MLLELRGAEILLIVVTVLILIVMEDALRDVWGFPKKYKRLVLILIVMEDALRELY